MENNGILRRCPTTIDWEKIERSSPEEQIEFFSEWKDKFEVELVSSGGKNVKKGDHLAIERYKILPNGSPLYTHHAICTSIHRDTKMITLSEYAGNISGILDVHQSGLKSLAKIKNNEYNAADLEEKMAYKVIWPKELRRYGVKKVTKRAKKRKDEQTYDPLKNNCEHFATWCKCGLNISLQARLWCLWARKIVDKILAGGNAIIESIVPVLLRVLATVPNKSVAAFASKSFAESLMSNLVEKGFINDTVISNIKEIFDEWMMKNADELLYERLVRMIKKTVSKFVEESCRTVGSMADSVYQSVKKGFGYDSVDGVDCVDGDDGDDGCTEELFNEFIEWCNDE
ncbi:uncharacterized protein LOC116308361 [Actinia tenebrosa]|uniref:Uncharacterized protein LOC116308361 n=1 Tax=Actinia tenebrosa TaxID=6105 RepID=A0A6P8J3N8_ACTTE|nr:uncharacterized protein LOC116308361 [Actinia tenebrosa]